MSMFVTHDSACWFWRHAGNFSRVLESRWKGTWSEDTPVIAVLSDKVSGKIFGNQPIHLLAPNDRQRPQKTKYQYHVCAKELPFESFCHIGDSVYVASPELALAQMRPSLSIIQFADLCMEFMGTYALREDMHRGFSTRQTPLVTCEKMLPALRALLGKRLYCQTASLLEHVGSGSRSPMETREYLLFFLPKRHGGYGLPKAKMNAIFELTPSQQQEAGRQYLECDLFWPEQKVAVEYDGKVDHASYEARAKDATKRNVLQACGIRQFTVTARQILDKRSFDAVARDIASALHIPLTGFPKDWEVRHDRLRDELFQSMKRRG